MTNDRNLNAGDRCLILPGGASEKWVNTVCTILEHHPCDQLLVESITLQNQNYWSVMLANGSRLAREGVLAGVLTRYLLKLPGEEDNQEFKLEAEKHKADGVKV